MNVSSSSAADQQRLEQIRVRVATLTHEKAVAMARASAVLERLDALRDSEAAVSVGALDRVETLVMAALDDELILIDEDAEVLGLEVAAIGHRGRRLRS